ncbi:MAG: SlyX family protein [Planctomycetia bacterium]|nr:SlyX family protein [Planctomycetia bacterium]
MVSETRKKFLGELPESEKEGVLKNWRILLEERLTFCEHLNETLDGVVRDLQNRLTRLEFRCDVMAEEIRRLQNMNREGISSVPQDQKPPHY